MSRASQVQILSQGRRTSLASVNGRVVEVVSTGGPSRVRQRAVREAQRMDAQEVERASPESRAQEVLKIVGREDVKVGSLIRSEEDGKTIFVSPEQEFVSRSVFDSGGRARDTMTDVFVPLRLEVSDSGVTFIERDVFKKEDVGRGGSAGVVDRDVFVRREATFSDGGGLLREFDVSRSRFTTSGDRFSASFSPFLKREVDLGVGEGLEFGAPVEMRKRYEEVTRPVSEPLSPSLITRQSTVVDLRVPFESPVSKVLTPAFEVFGKVPKTPMFTITPITREPVSTSVFGVPGRVASKVSERVREFRDLFSTAKEVRKDQEVFVSPFVRPSVRTEQELIFLPSRIEELQGRISSLWKDRQEVLPSTRDTREIVFSGAELFFRRAQVGSIRAEKRLDSVSPRVQELVGRPRVSLPGLVTETFGLLAGVSRGTGQFVRGVETITPLIPDIARQVPGVVSEGFVSIRDVVKEVGVKETITLGAGTLVVGVGLLGAKAFRDTPSALDEGKRVLVERPEIVAVRVGAELVATGLIARTSARLFPRQVSRASQFLDDAVFTTRPVSGVRPTPLLPDLPRVPTGLVPRAPFITRVEDLVSDVGKTFRESLPSFPARASPTVRESVVRVFDEDIIGGLKSRIQLLERGVESIERIPLSARTLEQQRRLGEAQRLLPELRAQFKSELRFRRDDGFTFRGFDEGTGRVVETRLTRTGFSGQDAITVFDPVTTRSRSVGGERQLDLFKAVGQEQDLRAVSKRFPDLTRPARVIEGEVLVDVGEKLVPFSALKGEWGLVDLTSQSSGQVLGGRVRSTFGSVDFLKDSLFSTNVPSWDLKKPINLLVDVDSLSTRAIPITSQVTLRGESVRLTPVGAVTPSSSLFDSGISEDLIRKRLASVSDRIGLAVDEISALRRSGASEDVIRSASPQAIIREAFKERDLLRASLQSLQRPAGVLDLPVTEKFGVRIPTTEGFGGDVRSFYRDIVKEVGLAPRVDPVSGERVVRTIEFKTRVEDVLASVPGRSPRISGELPFVVPREFEKGFVESLFLGVRPTQSVGFDLFLQDGGRITRVGLDAFAQATKTSRTPGVIVLPQSGTRIDVFQTTSVGRVGAVARVTPSEVLPTKLIDDNLFVQERSGRLLEFTSERFQLVPSVRADRNVFDTSLTQFTGETRVPSSFLQELDLGVVLPVRQGVVQQTLLGEELVSTVFPARPIARAKDVVDELPEDLPLKITKFVGSPAGSVGVTSLPDLGRARAGLVQVSEEVPEFVGGFPVRTTSRLIEDIIPGKVVSEGVREVSSPLLKTVPTGNVVGEIRFSGLRPRYEVSTKYLQDQLPSTQTISKTSSSLKSSLKTTNIQTRDLASALITSQALKMGSLVIPITKTSTLQAVRTAQQLKSLQATQLITQQSTITTTMLQSTQTSTSTSSFSTPSLTPIFPGIGTPRLRLPTRTPPRRVRMPEIDKEARKISKGVEDDLTGYDVEVKQGGKWIKANRTPLRRKDALSKGARIVDHTTSASYRVTQTKKKVTHPPRESSYYDLNAHKFEKKETRTGKVLTEKNKYRIDTFGEVQGIPYKGLEEQKRRRNLFGLRVNKKENNFLTL